MLYNVDPNGGPKIYQSYLYHLFNKIEQKLDLAAIIIVSANSEMYFLFNQLCFIGGRIL